MLFDDYSTYMPTNYTPAATDNQMGDIMRHFWVHFARYGDTPSSTIHYAHISAHKPPNDADDGFHFSDDGFAKWWPINGNNVHWPADYNTYRLTVQPTVRTFFSHTPHLRPMCMYPYGMITFRRTEAGRGTSASSGTQMVSMPSTGTARASAGEGTETA
jgi:hypothetical protein